MGTQQGMRAREDDTLEVRGRFFFWRASPLLFATAFACASFDFSCAFCAGFLKRESINEQANNRLELAFGALCGCGYPD